MTLTRRIAAVETALTPTQLVLRWLDEAHAFSDLESYVRSQLAEPSSEGPLDRLAREAASGVRVSLRGKRPEVVDAAIARGLRETVFRFDLVTGVPQLNAPEGMRTAAAEHETGLQMGLQSRSE